MKNNKYEKLLIKNTLSIAIPAIVVFLVIVILFARYPMAKEAKCYDISDFIDKDTKINEMYHENTPNISLEVTDLEYTGFDYYIDGKLKGAYYYTLADKGVRVYLIETDNPKKNIPSRQIKGKIIKEDVSLDHIFNQFAAANNIEFQLIKDLSTQYIISEVDYKAHVEVLIYLLLFSPIVICVIILCYAIIIWHNPVYHPQSKQLEAYGDVKTIIGEIDKELSNEMVFRHNNIYITTNYMLISYISKMQIIKLDYIKYMSKNEILRSGIINKDKGKIYRLTMTNPDCMVYEVDFTSESLVDDVIKNIRGEE